MEAGGYDSDEEQQGPVRDEYLLSDKFDPGVWLVKAPATKIGRSKRRWFVLHRRERQLVYYTMAFIPPAKAGVKGVIKLQDITGISCRNTMIEISVARGRSMYKLQADDDKTAADWTYILKVETQQIKPEPGKKSVIVEYMAVTPNDDSYLEMGPDRSNNVGDGAYLAMAPDSPEAAQAEDGSYLAMAPDAATTATAPAGDAPDVTAAAAEDDGSYVPLDPTGAGSYVPVEPGADADDVATATTGGGEGGDSYLEMAPGQQGAVELTADANGFGLTFGGPKDAEVAAANGGGGIFVAGMKEGSQATRCNGIRIGMQITSIDGTDVTSASCADLSEVLKDAGETVKFQLQANPDLYTKYGAAGAVEAAESVAIDDVIPQTAHAMRARTTSAAQYSEMARMTINVAEADKAADADDNGDSYLEMMPERKTDPSSYMEMLPDGDTGAPTQDHRVLHEFEDDCGIPNYVALHDFAARNFDEVDAVRGHVFRITEIWPDGWYFGQNLDTTKVGIIPGNYLFAAVLPEDAPAAAAPVVLEVFPDRYMTLEPDPQ
jgi:hypothetical protein